MLLSIIIPLYNGEKTIERCIKSVMNQLYKNIEIIIINDGSSDKSEEIVNKYLKEDTRISLINQENKGLSETRNVGMRIAKGELIGFIDADDEIPRDYYSILVNRLYVDDTDLVLAKILHIYGVKEMMDQFNETINILEKTDILEQLIFSMLGKIDYYDMEIDAIMGSVCRGVFKRNLIYENNIYFSSDIKMSEDLIFLIEILMKSEKISLTNDTVYKYIHNSESITESYNINLEKSYEAFNNKLFTLISKSFLESKKSWAWRKVYEIYVILMNECKSDNPKTIFEIVDFIKKVIERNDFLKYANELNLNECYGFSRLTIISLKKGYILPIIIYYKIRGIFR